MRFFHTGSPRQRRAKPPCGKLQDILANANKEAKKPPGNIVLAQLRQAYTIPLPLGE